MSYAVPLSTGIPSLYVSEGFVEAMPDHDVTHLMSNPADIHALRDISDSRLAVPNLGALVVSSPRENGRRTTYHFVGTEDNVDYPFEPMPNATFKWKDIKDQADDARIDVLRATKAVPTELSVSDAVYRAFVSYHGRRGIRPAPLEIFGTASGFGLGLAASVIPADIMYGEYGQFGTKVLVGTVAGATALNSLLKRGKRHYDKEAIDISQPVIMW